MNGVVTRSEAEYVTNLDRSV